MLDSAIPPVPPEPLFSLDVRASGTTSTVAVAGELDLAVAERFDAAVATAIAETPETLVIDLSALEFVDSTGMHALLRAHRHAAARNLRLIIIPGSKHVQSVFALCGLDTVLPFVSVRMRTV